MATVIRQSTTTLTTPSPTPPSSAAVTVDVSGPPSVAAGQTVTFTATVCSQHHRYGCDLVRGRHNRRQFYRRDDLDSGLVYGSEPSAFYRRNGRNHSRLASRFDEIKIHISHNSIRKRERSRSLCFQCVSGTSGACPLFRRWADSKQMGVARLPMASRTVMPHPGDLYQCGFHRNL